MTAQAFSGIYSARLVQVKGIDDDAEVAARHCAGLNYPPTYSSIHLPLKRVQVSTQCSTNTRRAVLKMGQSQHTQQDTAQVTQYCKNPTCRYQVGTAELDAEGRITGLVLNVGGKQLWRNFASKIWLACWQCGHRFSLRPHDVSVT